MNIIHKLARFIDLDNKKRRLRLGDVSIGHSQPNSMFGKSIPIFYEDIQAIHDERALYNLIEAQDSNDVGLRCAATAALGQIGDERAIPKLEELVRSDPRREVREFAVCALGKIDIETVREALESALKDRSKYVRRKAHNILNATGILDLKTRGGGPAFRTNIEIYQELMKFAVFEEERLPWTYAREVYGWPERPILNRHNIACIKDPKAVNILVEALDSDVYSAAMDALVIIGDDRVIPALEKIVCNDYFGSKERYAALKALKEFGSEKINVETLRFALNDKNDEMRWLASELYPEHYKYKIEVYEDGSFDYKKETPSAEEALKIWKEKNKDWKKNQMETL